MGEGRHADVEGVERLLGQHGVEIRVGAGAEALGRPCARSCDRIGEGREVDVLELLQHAEMAVRDPTRPDETDPGSRCPAPSCHILVVARTKGQR